MNTTSLLKPASMLFALCLLTVGCIPVKNVEKAWKTSKIDNSLLGVWEQRGGGKLGFVKTEKDFLLMAGNNGEGGCRTFESNGHKFLVIANLKAAVLGFDLVEDDDKNGNVLRYKIDGDKLTMYTYDAGRLKAAIEDGKVPGVVDENDSAELKELDAATIKWLGETADGPGWSEQVYKKKKNKNVG